MPFILLKLIFFNSFSMFFPTFELSLKTVLIPFILNGSFPTQQSFQEISLVNRAFIPLKPPFSFLLSQVIVSFIRTFIVLFHSASLRLLIFPSSIVIKIGDFICIDTCVIAGTYEIAGIGIDEDGLVEYWLIILLQIAFKISLKISILLEFVKLNISLWSLIQPFLISIRINDIKWTLDLPYFAYSLRNLCQFLDALLNVLINHGKRCYFHLFFDYLLTLILLLQVFVSEDKFLLLYLQKRLFFF